MMDDEAWSPAFDGRSLGGQTVVEFVTGESQWCRVYPELRQSRIKERSAQSQAVSCILPELVLTILVSAGNSIVAPSLLSSD